MNHVLDLKRIENWHLELEKNQQDIEYYLHFYSSLNSIYNLLSFLISLIVLIVFFMIIKNNNIKKYPLLMIFAGAIGNLYDRISYKAVPDFIDFHVGEFHWFIFNVADIFISLGVFFMILIELIDNSKNNETL